MADRSFLLPPVLIATTSLMTMLLTANVEAGGTATSWLEMAAESATKLTEYNWIVALSFVFAFFLAFGLGANDVANSFATSVGAKVLTLKQACVIAAFAEFAGAVLLGARVSDTIQSGIAQPDTFDDPAELMLGHMCAMLATAIWLNVATRLKLPVSGSHSIVSGIIGFTLVAVGSSGIDWWEFGLICISWVTSPLLAGFFSVTIFLMVKFGILRKENSFEVGLMAVPFIYFATILVNTVPVTMQLLGLVETEESSSNESSGGLSQQGLNIIIAVSTGLFLGLVTGIVVRIWVVPYTRRTIDEKYDMTKAINYSSVSAASINPDVDAAASPDAAGSPDVAQNGDENTSLWPSLSVESRKTEQLFKWLQILSATFAAFVHGANDVSNAIGPLAAVFDIWQTGEITEESSTPIWILVYGAVGIVLGLLLWGQYVIETVGEKLTSLSPSRGFCIEIGASLTVLIASWAGIPVSTTHCKVGAVVAVGYASNEGSVSWKMFGVIVLSWIVTIPFAGCLSAAFFAMFRPAL